MHDHSLGAAVHTLFRGRMEVQGEGIMHLSELEGLQQNGHRAAKKCAQRGCAGALRNLDTRRRTAARSLDAYFYNVGYIEGRDFDESHAR